MNLITGANIKSEKAKPSTKRVLYYYLSYAISTFEEKYVFISGGFNGYNSIKTVEYYSVSNNEWANAPEMNETRSYHSQCSIGDFLFVIFGYGGNSY